LKKKQAISVNIFWNPDYTEQCNLFVQAKEYSLNLIVKYSWSLLKRTC